MRIFDREPVLVMALVQTAIALATSFGLDLTADQTATLLAFSAAVLSFVARKKVTPNG